MKNKKKKEQVSVEKRMIRYALVIFILYVILSFCYFYSNGKWSQEVLFPFCVDFGLFYAAGKMTLSGNAAQIFNIPAHHALLERILNTDLPFYLPWLYPPIFLLAIVPFAFLPYHLAMVLWLIITLALALFAVYRMLPKRKELALFMLGFPGVLMNMRWGQNGFLNTALLAISICYLESNPVLSGVMIGLLAYKPQFAFFPFVILLFSRKWKAVLSAVGSAVAVSLLSLLAFGSDVWVQFFGSFFHAFASLGGTEQLSVFSIQMAPYTTLLNLGVDSRVSIAIQGIITVSVILATLWVWKHTKRLPLKGAMMVLGIPLSIPYFMQYDLMILALPLVLLVYDFFENGCSKTEIGLTALLWLLPLINWPLVLATHVQICPPVLIAIAVMILLRVKRDKSTPALQQAL